MKKSNSLEEPFVGVCIVSMGISSLSNHSVTSGLRVEGADWEEAFAFRLGLIR